MEWTRRQVLGALGASTAAWLVHACARDARRSAGPGAPAMRGTDQIRDQLREAVTELSRRFPRATALAVVRRTGGAVVDAGERGVGEDRAAWLVLAVATRARGFEQATGDLSAEGIARAMATLEARAAAVHRPGGPPRSLAGPRTFAPASMEEPAPGQAAWSPDAWLARADELHARAGKVGGSRVVYRGAYVLVDDWESVFVGRGRDLAQRLVRTRAGVLLAAHGPGRHGGGAARGPAGEGTLRVEEVGRGGRMGLAAADLSSAALETAAAGVLALTSPARSPDGTMDLILAPDLAALILHRCVAPALTADRWLSGEARAAALAGRSIGPASLTLIDDPTDPAGYGSHAFDDEGQAASPVVLVDAGALGGPLTDRRTARALGLPRTGHARRMGLTDPAVPMPSNLALAPGHARLDELVAGIDHGLLLEGGRMARVDLGTWRFVARAARAYEIRRGKLTGVLFGDMDVHGDVPGLLGAVQGLSRETRSTCHGGGPLPAASVTSPAMWTRARVSAGAPGPYAAGAAGRWGHAPPGSSGSAGGDTADG